MICRVYQTTCVKGFTDFTKVLIKLYTLYKNSKTELIDFTLFIFSL